MSYLNVPRLHFAGQFQADVSTVNNDVRHYKNEAFQPQYQEFGRGGGWNPVGTAIFRLVDCSVTSAYLDEKKIVDAAIDPVIGMALENANDRVFGKLVDLDPQQQMVSEIWGMRLRLTDGSRADPFTGDFRPVAFVDLWGRQFGSDSPRTDQLLGAVYQSVLENVIWSGSAGSAVLAALEKTTEDSMLSIDINVYGYGRDPADPRYTIGRVVGSIGPYFTGEPKHFVLGRQIAPLANAPRPPVSGQVNYVDWFCCKVDGARSTLTADFGNCLPIADAAGELYEQGPLILAVYREDASTLLSTVTADQVEMLGEVAYRQPGWYAQSAGVQDFDYSANAWCVENIAARPLVLLIPQSGTSYRVLCQESLGGLYLRADNFVLRLEPGAMEPVDLYASRYGAPIATELAFGVNTGFMGGTGAGNQPLNPPVETPQIGLPADGASYPSNGATDAAGKFVLEVQAGTLVPAVPRGYIDGQLYGIGYAITQQPANTIPNFWNLISVLVFSPFAAPAQPTWHADIQPILTQFGNLYPIMSKHLVDLGSYESVVEHLAILQLAFSLPIGDPNYMPVTRDLSAAKRAMILHWMSTPGADGLPLKGAPQAAPVAAEPLATMAPVALDLHPLQTQGKTAVMLEYEARTKEARPS